MSTPSGVKIADECISSAGKLKSQRGASKPRFIIFKISDDEKTVEVEHISSENDYQIFLDKLSSASGANDRAAPRYAAYDVEYDLGEDGKRMKTIFISWVPSNAPIKARMLYASTREQLNKALNLGASIHADDLDDINWDSLVHEVSRGRV